VDGRVIEMRSADDFFERPLTSLGARYLRDGNCWPVKPEDFQRAVDHDEPDSEEPEEVTFPSLGPPLQAAHDQALAFSRPGGFHWVIKGRLGGMQRPGLLRDEDDDLKALSSLGAQYLVSLTEEAFPPERLAKYGVVGIHFPIVDMGVPELQAAAQLIASINRRVDAGMPTILHCKAGLGRTGTLLACLLVFRDFTAVAAINEVRCVNPRYIQSDEQLQFISQFAEYLESNPNVRRAGAG
jgi:atypical dual specificity phosphatase